MTFVVPTLIILLAPQSTTVTECVDDSVLAADTGCSFPGPHCDTSKASPVCGLCTLAEHCDDGDSCTIDYCSSGMCLSDPKPEGDACDDGYCHEGSCWESLGATDDSAVVGPQGTAFVAPTANDLVAGSDVQIVQLPAHGEAWLDDAGHIGYTPNDGFSGVDWLVYESCTDDNICDQAKVVYTVQGQQDLVGPGIVLAVDDQSDANPGERLALHPLNNDLSSSPALVISSVGEPMHGEVTWQVGTDKIFYQAASGFVGDDRFEVTACDENGFCDTSSMRVRLGASANTAPVTRSRTVKVGAAGQRVLLDLLQGAHDAEGHEMYPQSIVASGMGQLELTADSQATLVGDGGDVTLTYEVCDILGACNATVITIEIPAVEYIPVPLLQPNLEPEVRRERAALANDPPATRTALAPSVAVMGASGDSTGGCNGADGSGPSGLLWALAALIGILATQRKRGSLAVSSERLKN